MSDLGRIAGYCAAFTLGAFSPLTGYTPMEASAMVSLGALLGYLCFRIR